MTKKPFQIIVALLCLTLAISQIILMRENSELKAALLKKERFQPNSVATFHSERLLKEFPDSLFKSGDSLVVARIMKNPCTACIDSIFSISKRLVSIVGRKNVVVLLGNFPDYEYWMYKRIHKYDFRAIYWIPEDITSIDRMGGTSYCFLVTKDNPKSAEYIFAPNLAKPKETDAYLQQVQKFLSYEE